MDAIILDTLFNRPVWSLARGDVFKNKFIRNILTSFKILPIYRTSEGVGNLLENYKTFDSCVSIFKKNGTVLIFSEARSINEWHLRPLRKGTARLVSKCQKENISLKVLPVGINYNSFRRFGKNVFINFGEFITYPVPGTDQSDGVKHQLFTNKLKDELNKLVFEIDKTDTQLQKEKLSVKVSLLKKILFFIPASIGWLVHAPLYLPLKRVVWKKTQFNDHFDSVLVTLLFFTYPLYLLLIAGIAFLITESWLVFLLLLLIPFCAWSYVQVKSQLDK
jgi:1-acyl-sn-glycerol-3-phosphate acyltransferase